MTRLLLAGAIMTALVAATMTTSAVGADDAAPVETRETYVALGDSAAAGFGIDPEAAPPCRRSPKNFATLTATTLRATTFDDRTCSAAKFSQLVNVQGAPEGFPTVRPQLEGVDADTTLVTLGPIGANDVGIYQEAGSCATTAGCLSRESGAVLASIDNADTGTRKLTGWAIDQIRSRSPRALIVVVGYGEYLPPEACEAMQPQLTADENIYIQGLVDHLNEAQEQAASDRGVAFVDSSSIPGAAEHTGCATEDRWMEGYTTLDDAAPFHPTALGMQVQSTAVTLAVLQARADRQAVDQGKLVVDRKALDAEIATAAADRSALQKTQAQLAADRSALDASRAELTAERTRLDSARSAQLTAAARSVRGQAVCRGSKVVLRVLGSPLAVGADFRAGSRLLGRDSSGPISLSVSTSSVRKHPGSLTGRVRLRLEGSSRSVVVKISRPRCARTS